MNFMRSIGLKLWMTIGPINLDCALVPEPDAASLECIARVCLAAQDRAIEVRIENASPHMRELIEFCGLSKALGVEVERHPE
jgi:ABC-type transporter Mla MlaB component